MDGILLKIEDKMTSRERVMKALSHKEPDRVPLNFGGTASNLTDIAYFKLKRYLNIEGEIRPYRRGHTGNYFDQRILEKLDTDFRYVVMKEPQPIIKDKDTIVDEWGITIKKINNYGVRIGPPPLEKASEKDLQVYNWPNPYDPLRTEGLEEEAKKLYETTDKVIVARAPLSASFIEYGIWLRGAENFFVDLIANKKFANRLLDKLLEIQIGFYDAFLKKVGKYVQIVETAEDYGTQQGCLISPRLFREMIKPRRKELNLFIKSRWPHLKILHHSCGSIWELVEDLIDTQIDILNPVQPLAKNMDSEVLKKKFGSKICFDGAIDTQKALPGSIDEVREEVIRRIKALAPGGGYILAPANHIQPDVPPENVVALFNFARKYGKYPIKL